jgi:hypothetical protein
VPVGNVLVCDTGSNIEHDDSALALDATNAYNKVNHSKKRVLSLFKPLTSNRHEDHQTFLDQRYPRC